jgi:glutamate-1-semialdehyde 2,1-aminomutase
MAGLQQATQETGLQALIQGPGPMFHMGFTAESQVQDYRGMFSYDTAKYGRFLAGMHNRGIRLIGRGLWYVSSAHNVEDIDHCIQTAYEVLKEI